MVQKESANKNYRDSLTDLQQDTTEMVTARAGRTIRPIQRYSGEEYASYMLDLVKPELVALKATTDPDIMYYHQVMAQPNQAEWIKAM